MTSRQTIQLFKPGTDLSHATTKIQQFPVLLLTENVQAGI